MKSICLLILLAGVAKAQPYNPYVTNNGDLNIPNGKSLELNDPTNGNFWKLSSDSSQNLNVSLNGAASTVVLSTTTGLVLNKNLSVAAFVATSTASVSSVIVGSGVHKATATASGYLIAPNWTHAQLIATTPLTAELGGQVTCVDCAAAYSICVATGATIQGYRLGGSGTSECK